jgi:hypothetical protein
LAFEFPIINEKMLGFGGNGLTLGDYPIDTGTGITTYALERLTMQNLETVDQVEQLWNMWPRESGNFRFKYFHHWDNSISVWCDKYDGILMIEQMHSYFNPVASNPTDEEHPYFLWHSNHHLWNGTTVTGSIVPSPNETSWIRAHTAYNLLNDKYGRIDIEFLLNTFIKNHRGYPPDSSDICRHHTFIPLELGETMFSWIIEPKTSWIHWTTGKYTPCQSGLYGEKIDNIFNNAASKENL